MTADGHVSAATRDALLDRELGPREEREALHHLLECRACRDAHGALLGAASLAERARGGPPLRAPRPLARLAALAGLAAAAAAVAAALWLPGKPPARVAPRAGEVVVHSLTITVTREADGLVSRDVRRLAPGGDSLSLERSRERIRPAARGGGGSLLVASRRTIPFGERTR